MINYAGAAISVLRALAAQKLNSQYGLFLHLRRAEHEWPVRAIAAVRRTAPELTEGGQMVISLQLPRTAASFKKPVSVASGFSDDLFHYWPHKDD